MSKPICVIYLPENYDLGSGADNAAIAMMEALNGLSDGKHKATDYWKEYYWFCFPKAEITEPEFQVFYEKDFTEIQFKELEKLITDSLNQIKSKP